MCSVVDVKEEVYMTEEIGVAEGVDVTAEVDVRVIRKLM